MIIVFLALVISSTSITPKFILMNPSAGTTGFKCDLHNPDCKPCKRPDGITENKPPDVTEIDLEKTELRLPPQKEGEPPAGRQNHRDMIVNVVTTAEDPEGDIVTYHYMISGGRIVGTGSRVSWDLSGVGPGTYTITAGLDDGCGVCGKTITRTISVSQD